MEGHRNRVVVVGGGVGGLNVARGLADADMDVTLVDRTNHHLFQPLLYQVAAGILAPDLIAPALRRTVKKQANARTLLAEVYHLGQERKVVVAREPDGRMLELAGERSWIEGGASVFAWVLRRQLVSARPPSMEDAAC
jgi:NADH:ubiquinone reductase (H+-translocating)